MPSVLCADTYKWKSVAINGGGFVAGIVTHPAARGLMYARTDVGGAYRWDAGFNTWIAITDWITARDGNLMGCESIAVDESDPNRVYLALGMYTNSWGQNGAIVRSNDRGATFERTDLPFKMGGNCPGRSVGERLVVDPNDGRVLLFGSRANGLWKSADQGRSWSKVASFPAVSESPAAYHNGGNEWALGISFVQFDRASGKPGTGSKIIYAGVCTQQTCFFRSTDGGSSWQAVAGQPIGMRPNHMVIAPSGLIDISYGDQEGPNDVTDGAIWQFDPASDHWTDITPVKPSRVDRFGYGAVTLDAQHPDTLMATSLDRWGRGDTVFRSTDNGKNWSSQTVGGKLDSALLSAPDAPWGTSLSPHWLGSIAIDPFDSGHALFVTGYGIWVTHEATSIAAHHAAHWTFEDRGLEETVPLELVSPPRGPQLVSVIGDFDGFTHDDVDRSPLIGRHFPHMGTSSGLDFAESRPSRIVRTGGRGEGFVSDDGGHAWKAFETRPPGAKSGGKIAISSDGNTLLWQPGGALAFRSVDLGKTWVVCQGLVRSCEPVADRADPSRFYAIDTKSGDVFTSDDGGDRFSFAAGLSQHVGSVRAVPGRKGDLWIVAGESLYHSTDGCRSFLKLEKVQKAQQIGFGKHAPAADHPAVFLAGSVGGDMGLFRSDDAGKSWARLDDDQHHFGRLNVVIGDPRIYGRVYVGTSGRGIIYGDLAVSPR